MIVQELVDLSESVAPFIDLFDKEDVKKLLETDRLQKLFLFVFLIHWKIYILIIIFISLDRDHTVILDHLRNNYAEVDIKLYFAVIAK